jgi:hypothetical protein
VRRRAHAAAAAAVLLAAAPLAGCGAASPDLFEVVRSGADANADVTVVVNDGGNVTCDGRRHPLGADRLLKAREIARDLAEPAQLGLELPPGPGTQLAYRVRLEAGRVSFSDTSSGQPRVFRLVTGFTKDVTEDVCGIARH